MRENDEITGLFRSRLAGAEMTVREDFWEGLQRDLPSPVAAKGRRQHLLSPSLHRVDAADRGNQGGLYTSGGHDAGR